ncbi:hypothetical protein BU25DRAFT_390615 [Macroventuria anomochaeta]|uniref:Uncharacterized protein n=1 Tax=Macroventuria anomochaeta TaxID=301207 RepID=A0ACB6S3K7_9PLEO|nr:uncharacterized protein BU25DRAFT_390615 [Macroventuria anomochaeta]KAF2628751.1 hypothetical protein BU25DRAFT_390615 [Macroventuria anomochaeta]
MSLLTYPPNGYHLLVKQQPREALVVAKGKEKARKAIDPPPVVQLEVKSTIDPQKNFLQNPYLFMMVSLYKADRDEPLPGNESMTGTLSSALHRLKDHNNVDVGLFVFGDISVKMLGTYRLHFRLYEFNPDIFSSQYLACTTSDKFSVLAPKDFKGMEESTSLSRLIADQGVRLRLRKEARTAAGSKRSYPYDSPVSIAQAHPSLPNEYSSSYEVEHSPIKRESTYNSTSQTEASSHSTIEQPYGAQPPYKRSFPSYPPVGQQSSITAPYSMMSHPSIVGHHSSLISPSGVLPSNTTSAYAVDTTGLYGSSTYPSSGSTYQGTAAQYPGAGYNSVFFNNYDGNLPR